MTEKKNIQIEWLSDYSDCETCGGSYSEGARVTGAVELDLIPRASCFGGDHWSTDDVFRLIFEKLGYQLETTY